MNEEVLRDRTGKMIGRIKALSDGKLEIRDHTGRMRGRYDPKQNVTRDHTGKQIGKGNLLATLLTP